MPVPTAERLRLSDFDYDLPESLIAQEPAPVRDQSRLMVLDRSSDRIDHKVFSDIEQYLVPGDVLVVNDTRVIPCRVPARKPGGGKAEVFLLAEKGLNLWEALVMGEGRTNRRLRISSEVEAEIVGSANDGIVTVRFHGVPDIRQLLAGIGKTPLPPYIKREPAGSDRERYQTVYASREGAVAAPTAGLHFTDSLLVRLRARGVEIVPLTLHVGPGTFQPVRVDDVTLHRMLPERYDIPMTTAEGIARAKAAGRRVVAVGTTSVRALESAAAADGTVRPGAGETSLFIYPGYGPGCQFRVVGALVTNFHLPKSTLLMLVAAFAGRERILSAYRTAVAEKYRFYSYGDAMLIV